MRRLAIALALALCLGTAQAEGPTYEDKFNQYVALGWPPYEIVAGLKRWFGLPFELATYSGETYVQLVVRRPDGSIYRLELIGKLPPRQP